MDEYINRDDLLKAAWGNPTLSLSVYDLGNIKPVDVAPVRKGRWESVGLSSLKCSDCGYLDDMKMYHRYCPDCGCFMR